MFDGTAHDQPWNDAPPRPHTLTVLLLLIAAAATFSYLGAYAVSDALVNADVLPHWSPGADPRPGWMLSGFGVLLLTFLTVAGAARFFSRRQLRKIDEMAE